MRKIVSGAVFCRAAFQGRSFAGAQIVSPPAAPTAHAATSPQIGNPPQSDAAPVVHNSTVVLTLEDAKTRAIKNQPRLLAMELRAQAANKRIAEVRSGYLPQMFGNLTAVDANGDSAVSAGALTTSSISTRTAAGASLTQLITDFGHTTNVLRSAHLGAQAAGQSVESVRQRVLMEVEEEYFAAQAAESVRKTAQAVLDFRRVTLRQVTALAQSQLRSTLDVQFVQVLVSEAELALVRADSNAEKSQAQLAAAMGEVGEMTYTLTDVPLPEAPDPDAAPYVKEALADRPDLKALRLESESATHEARAERDLNFPTVDALATGGEVPIHDSTIRHDYGAVDFNINIPVFTGDLYQSRAAEAKLEARAANEDASLHTVEIARDVRMAWADARDAYLQIGVMQRLVDEGNVAMRLAQARYDAGLGSIVELNQAELNQTSALIGAASARFDYLRSMTAFQFAMGNLH